jgi:LysM repeat protein
MFVQDRVVLAYARPRPRRRRGFGRVILLAAALLVASARLAYGSAPAHYQTVVVAPGDSLWTIASAHYGGDPRSHVDAILVANHLAGPSLTPGQSLILPQS